MIMSRSKKDTNPIALELNKYEAKVKELQDYLEAKSITAIGDDASRHKEIEVQLKMMEKIPFYLGEIKKLRTVVQEGVDKLMSNSLMGDRELSPIEQGII